MADKTNNLSIFIKDIADTLRAKMGTTELINPQDFSSKISAISAEKPEQEKSLSISNNGDYQILPDSGKALSKVEINVNVPTGVDVSDTTATPDKVLNTAYFYTADGVRTQGEIVPKEKVSRTISGKSDIQYLASGYYKYTSTVQIASAEQAKIIPENIKEGVTILGVSGTLEGGTDTTDATATAGDILSGKTAYVNGGKTTGTMTDNSDVEQITVTNPSGNYVPKGYYADIRTQLICQGAQNIVPENIKNGVSFLGVTGTLSASPEYDFATDSLIMSADSSFYEPIDDINVSLSDGFTLTLTVAPYNASDNVKIYQSDIDTAGSVTPDSELLLDVHTGTHTANITKPYVLLVKNTAASIETYGGIANTGTGGLNYSYKVTGNCIINVITLICLTGDTLVTMSDYSTKRLDEIELGDSVLSFDFDKNKLIPRKVIYTDKDENKSHTEYDKWTFDDGTVIKTVHRHEFYNVEAQRMKYMDEWNIGEHTYKIDGSKPKLIAHETVYETVNHYKITLEGSTNYFANGLLNGDRYCPKNIKLPEVK